MFRRGACRGFTLIELMVVVTIAGVLAAFALPSFHQTLVSNRIRSTATELHLSLLAARSEAVKRSADVNVVPNSSSWLNGWKVIVPSDSSVVRASDAPNGVSLTCSGSSCSTVTFERSGRSRQTGTPVEFDVYPQDNTVAPMRCVTISLSGVPRVTVDTDNDTSNGCN